MGPCKYWLLLWPKRKRFYTIFGKVTEGGGGDTPDPPKIINRFFVHYKYKNGDTAYAYSHWTPIQSENWQDIEQALIDDAIREYNIENLDADYATIRFLCDTEVIHEIDFWFKQPKIIDNVFVDYKWDDGETAYAFVYTPTAQTENWQDIEQEVADEAVDVYNDNELDADYVIIRFRHGLDVVHELEIEFVSQPKREIAYVKVTIISSTNKEIAIPGYPDGFFVYPDEPLEEFGTMRQKSIDTTNNALTEAGLDLDYQYLVFKIYFTIGRYEEDTYTP